MHKLQSAKINASIRFCLVQIPLPRNYVAISSSLLSITGIPVEVEMGVNFSPIRLPILPNLVGIYGFLLRKFSQCFIGISPPQQGSSATLIVSMGFLIPRPVQS